MKSLLLSRRSPFQTYCANTLFRRGILGEVVLESGVAFPPKPMTLQRAAKRIAEAAAELPTHPVRTARRVSAKLKQGLYYGGTARHDQRILKEGYESLDEGLKCSEFKSVNEPSAARHIRESGAEIVFVFGTGIVKPHVFEGSQAVFVNMHWGWSPDYRGEGIVSALAGEGPGALGVTVHIIDPGIDSGDILYRRRPTVDAEDNFYSIGLKLAMIGTELFIEAYKTFRHDGGLKGEPQDKSTGRLYSSRHLREHPELYAKAWSALRNGA